MIEKEDQRIYYPWLTYAKYFFVIWIATYQLIWFSTSLGNTRFETLIWINPSIGSSFFYIASGFLLTKAFPPNINLPNFYGKQFWRAYPSFFVTQLIYFGLAFFTIKGVFTLFNVLLMVGATLSLTSSWLVMCTEGSGPGYFLSTLAFLYFVFPLLRGKDEPPKLAIVILVAMLTFAQGAFAHALRPSLESYGTEIHFRIFELTSLPFFQVPSFVLGIFIAKMQIPNSIRPVLILAGIGLLIPTFQPNIGWFTAIPAALLVSGLSVSKETSKLKSLESLLITVGRSSYMVYLIGHMVAIYLGQKKIIKDFQDLAIAVVIILTVSLIAHLLFERPLITWIRRRFPNPRPTPNAGKFDL
jgi:hypothetical protein